MCLCMLMTRLARVSLRSSRCFSGTPRATGADTQLSCSTDITQSSSVADEGAGDANKSWEVLRSGQIDGTALDCGTHEGRLLTRLTEP